MPSPKESANLSDVRSRPDKKNPYLTRRRIPSAIEILGANLDILTNTKEMNESFGLSQSAETSRVVIISASGISPMKEDRHFII